MNRMETVFTEMKKRNRKILIPYFPIGDTIFENRDIEWAQKFFDCGADVLEIGLPYENPVYDGQTVRDSMARALSHTNVSEVFQTIKRIREQCPNNILQIMTYNEIILRYGIESFADMCHSAGVDSVLAPNASRELRLELDQALGVYNIHFLRFAPFHLTEEWIEELQACVTGGYIFQQAVDGVTGEQAQISPQIGVNVQRIKGAGVTTPVCAGFGISNDAQAREAINMGADGVIVGSAVLKHILAGDAEQFLQSLSAAMES